MVEVFKTDIRDGGHAVMLLDQIHKNFQGYKANFDLEDCDKILRVTCTTGTIQPYRIISLLKDFGCHAEVLPDDDEPSDAKRLISPHELFA
jgi:hypothetical protein